MRRVSLIVVVVVTLIGAISMAVWFSSQRFQDISTQQVLARMEKGDQLTIIDVREPYEYKAGHIPGAVLIPLGELSEHLSKLDKESEIFVVCRSGNRSRTAANLMAKNGFRQVRNVTGGMLAWTGPVAY